VTAVTKRKLFSGFLECRAKQSKLLKDMGKFLFLSVLIITLVLAGSVSTLGNLEAGGKVKGLSTESLLDVQDPGYILLNPVKHAVRSAVKFGVPIDTIVLLLLLPLVASVIAGARHLVGVQGFGILLPAALALVFVAVGPVVGIGLFLVIVGVATGVRMLLRKLKISLQYLPRMALILWAVVLGIFAIFLIIPLFTRPPDISDISIFPLIILVLLAEDFTRVQIGKSVRVAVSLTSETVILALVSFIILTLRSVQEFALFNPELLLISVAVFDFFLGKYAGLRLLELWRFRKLIKN